MVQASTRRPEDVGLSTPSASYPHRTGLRCSLPGRSPEVGDPRTASSRCVRNDEPRLSPMPNGGGSTATSETQAVRSSRRSIDPSVGLVSIATLLKSSLRTVAALDAVRPIPSSSALAPRPIGYGCTDILAVTRNGLKNGDSVACGSLTPRGKHLHSANDGDGRTRSVGSRLKLPPVPRSREVTGTIGARRS